MSVYIHIGYPKAGSTSLQQNLFANHSEILNLGLYPTSNVGNASHTNYEYNSIDLNIPYLTDDNIQKLYFELIQPDGVVYDECKAKKLWADIKSDYTVSSSDKPVILSHEGITSSRFANPELMEKARRIKNVFGEVKILIVIRARQQMLKSLYRDHPFDPRTLEYHKRHVGFSEWLDIDIKRKHGNLTNTLHFDLLAKTYEALFGQENVLVMPLEMLRADQELFCNTLSNFLEINPQETQELLSRPVENAGVSVAGNTYRRLKSVLTPITPFLRPFKSVLKPFDRRLFSSLKKIGGTEKVEVTESYSIRIQQIYAEDNNRLNQRRNLGLEKLGYFIG